MYEPVVLEVTVLVGDKVTVEVDDPDDDDVALNVGVVVADTVGVADTLAVTE